MGNSTPRFNRRQTLGLFAGAVAAAGFGVGGRAGAAGPAPRRRVIRSAQAAAPSGTLRYGSPYNVTRFDPHRSSSGYDQVWTAPVYERLIWQTSDVELQPGLSTEWDFVDEQTFEMTLREGVSFTDGEAFNAEAVKLNIERAK
ncbi:MAG: ABC transporter substrate-binding protein, partial [Desertimonas sp.]